MSIRSYSGLAAVLLLATSSLAGASENISIPAGTTHDGNVETRNGSIQISQEAVVEGSLESRNGSISTQAGVTARDVSNRNGTIELGEGGRYGRIESRNGRITIGNNNTTGPVETRNGLIRIGASSRIGAVDSRNGGVNIGEETIVDGPVGTRNGGIELASGSRVTGVISTRNGGVRLQAATAEQGIRTLAGDVLLRNGSRSGGDVIIEIAEDSGGRNNGLFGLFGSTSWPEAGDIRILEDSEVDGDVILVLPADYDKALPTVEIAEDARISGTLRVDSRVRLDVRGQVGATEVVEH